MMQGGVRLESEENKGSTFTLYLDNIKIGHKSTTKDDVLDMEIVFDKATVLIVDDIDENRRLVTENFANSNLEFIEARDGQEAIDVAQNQTLDFILMDLKMPNINGYDATKKITELLGAKAPPIVALSAAIQVSEEKLTEYGFSGSLTKPISKKDLTEEFSHYLSHRTIIHNKNKKSEKLSNNSLKFEDAILKLLDEQASVLYDTAHAGGGFDDIEAFATILQSIAEEHKVEALQEYAQSINQSIEVFDIENIDKLMSQYKDILSDIEELKNGK